MKKIALLILVVLVLLGMTATAFAKTVESYQQGVEVDASLVVASAPASGFDTGVGVTFGAGTMLPQIDRNLQGRVELSYFSWSATEFGVDVTYTRIPIDIAGRYYIPTQADNLKLYLQAGLEISFDKVEAAGPSPFGTSTSSESTSNLGIVPGVGIDYKINQNLSLVADLRAHLISDSYLTIQGGVAYHF